MSTVFCKGAPSDVPVPNISSLEQSDRIASISMHLQAFMPHFTRVHQQQSDLQLPTSPLLTKLSSVNSHRSNLVAVVNGLYQNLYPNQPAPEPEGGPMGLPPPQNIFQQKVYGCRVLKMFKEFLSKVMREMRMLKSNMCAERG